MTSLRFGLGVCVAGLLAATGCPAADDTTDTGNDSGAMTTDPGDTGTEASTSAGSAEESTGGSASLSHAVDIARHFVVAIVRAHRTRTVSRALRRERDLGGRSTSFHQPVSCPSG